MLSQVELGKSTPTINVLWRVAHALTIPWSALLRDEQAPKCVVLRAHDGKVLASQDGAFTSRVLLQVNEAGNIELLELHLAPGSREQAETLPPGNRKCLVVAAGVLTLLVADEQHLLDAGDAIVFAASVPHEYRNDGDDVTRSYLVMLSQRRDALP